MRVAIVALLLCGCGASPHQVSRIPAGPPQVIETSIGCNHSSFCMTCLPGYSMKMNCGLKFSPYCPGTKRVRMKSTPVAIIWSDGNTTHGETDIVLEDLGPCS